MQVQSFLIGFLLLSAGCVENLDSDHADKHQNSDTAGSVGGDDSGNDDPMPPVDADGDGIVAEDDCDDDNPNMPNGDADCDGVPTAEDCDDTDPDSTVVSDDSDCDGIPDSDIETVCNRWNGDRADLSEPMWNGSINTCDPGSVNQVAADKALGLVNLFRWISGLSPVQTDPVLNQMAQECALIMDAYNGLTHYPNENFTCYSDDGAQAAGSSNISPYAGIYSVDLYMSDPGNTTTLGHRRWILSNGLGPIGLGTTDDYSCMWVHGGSGADTAQWTAWPPPGVVPFELMQLAWATLAETGWSLQSDYVNLDNANVTVTRDDGEELPMTVTPLAPYYGSQWAISMIPSGWSSEPGRSYDVHVEASGGVIDYRVELVDCD